jgi:hypothetical protein
MSPGSAPPYRRTITILTAMRLGDCDSGGLPLAFYFMRYDLANRRNASRRRGWLLPCSAENYVAAVVRGRMDPPQI